MGVLKNDVGRPSNKTIMIRTILKGVCLIVVLAAAVAGGYYLNDYQRKSDKKEVKKVEKEEVKNMSIDEAERIIGSTIGTYYLKVAKILNSNQYKTFAAIVKSDSTKTDKTCKDLFGNNLESWGGSNDGKSWAIEYEDRAFLCYDENINIYKYEDVQKNFKELFVSGTPAKGIITNDLDIYYVYSKTENGYTSVSCECGGNGPVTISGVKKAVIKGNKLIIDIAEVGINPTDDTIVLNDGTKIDIPDDFNDDEMFDKYKDKIDVTLKLYYKLVDGNYKFDKAEDVK